MRPWRSGTALSVIGIAVGIMLTMPSTVAADTTDRTYRFHEYTSVLTTQTTGDRARITVAPPDGSAACSTPTVVSGRLHVAVMRAAYVRWAANPAGDFAIPGVADTSRYVYPTVVSTAPPTFDPAPASVAPQDRYTVRITRMDEGRYGAVTTCADPARPSDIDVHVRNFEIDSAPRGPTPDA